MGILGGGSGGGAGDDVGMIRLAVYCLTMSLMCSMMVAVLLPSTSDYSYADIEDYRDSLNQFTGDGMSNDTPWVLTNVYTPWIPGDDLKQDADGWLYGSSIDYEDKGKSASIHLDPGQKSAVPLSYSAGPDRPVQTIKAPWYVIGHSDEVNVWGKLAQKLGSNIYSTTYEPTQKWDYTGYRYVFDPVLPFAYNEDGSSKTSSVDGALSIVWYNYNGQEGISGGLQVYNRGILLASYSAADIISGYNMASTYASSYNFAFDGVTLKLNIMFDQDYLMAGVPLAQCWTAGYWSMAISSVSAGNFLDVMNSNNFSTTMGSMVDTIVGIFTFSLPQVDNVWMSFVLWLICALPAQMAICLFVARFVGGGVAGVVLGGMLLGSTLLG